MEWKFEGNLLPLPFVLHLRSQNCFSPDVPEEEKEKTVKDIPVTRRSPLGWILTAVVLVALAGWFWNKRGSEPAAAANEGKRVRSTLHLETFVLNLADPGQRSYLRVGIDLGLSKEAGKSENAPSVAQVRDTILSVIGLAKVEDLLTAKGKVQLKDDLLKALQERLPELGVEEIYASAQVDQRKVGRLALAIQVAFQELGVFPASTTQIPLDTEEPMPFSTVQVIQNAKHNTDVGRIASSPRETPGVTSEEADLTTLQIELQQTLGKEIALHEIALHRETEGLVISLREFGFFDSGSATLKPAALPALDRIASLLAIRNCGLRIEGHTDNIPIHTVQMSSNWELSAARSTELVRLLITRYRFAPERLAAAGFAEYHPIASNATEQGRALNRRVDMVVLKTK
jgi:chemotaxis protein MotB